jgi:hypothetical protein
VAETAEQTVIRSPEMAGIRPKPAATGPGGSPVHFQFDTLARVCFVCIPSNKGPE